MLDYKNIIIKRYALGTEIFVVLMSGLGFEKFIFGFLDTNTYLLEEDSHLLVIDSAE